MLYLFLILFIWLATALGAAVPITTPAFASRRDGKPQILPPPSPAGASPSLLTTPVVPTILGIPTQSLTTTETLTSTSTIPSSTTTLTFTSTSPPSIVATLVSATTVIQTVETTKGVNSTISATPLSASTKADDATTTTRNNAAAASIVWVGGSGIRIAWSIALGLLLFMNCSW